MGKIINCPYCNKEMERKYLESHLRRFCISGTIQEETIQWVLRELVKE